MVRCVDLGGARISVVSGHGDGVRLGQLEVLYYEGLWVSPGTESSGFAFEFSGKTMGD